MSFAVMFTTVSDLVPEVPKTALFAASLTHTDPPPLQFTSVSFQPELAGVFSHEKSAAIALPTTARVASAHIVAV